MKVSEIWRLVLLNIFENKFKVVLTSIGIVVGAATIVLVIAVGRGGQADVADQFKNLSAATIEITSSASSGWGRGGNGGTGGFPSASGGNRMPGGTMPGGGFSGGGFPGGGNFSGGFNLQTVNAALTQEDAEDIGFFLSDIICSTISANARQEVLGGKLEEAAQYTVAGVKPEYLEVSNLSLYLGDFITQTDEEETLKTCVLGYKLAAELFDSPIEAYDSMISINGTSFTVAGILQQMGTVASGISPDESIYVPYSAGAKYVFGRELNPQITIVAQGPDLVSKVIQDATTLLGESHPGASFTFSDAGSKMEAALQSSRTLSMLLTAVAMIVFIVGGIGIMNVLFVSVKERTGEIGILKALGMQRGSVLLEFLMEAVMISVFGGAAGVALGIAIIPIAEHFGVRMEPAAYGYIAAFGFAVLCGTLFGFYPAFKASGLIPVEALTQD